MFRASVLFCALLFTAPLWWQALVDQSISGETAIIRFLIAVPIAAILLGVLRYAAKPPSSRSDPAHHD